MSRNAYDLGYSQNSAFADTEFTINLNLECLKLEVPQTIDKIIERHVSQDLFRRILFNVFVGYYIEWKTPLFPDISISVHSLSGRSDAFSLFTIVSEETNSRTQRNANKMLIL